jgi:hypothetical protein
MHQPKLLDIFKLVMSIANIQRNEPPLLIKKEKSARRFRSTEVTRLHLGAAAQLLFSFHANLLSFDQLLDRFPIAERAFHPHQLLVNSGRKCYRDPFHKLPTQLTTTDVFHTT